MRRPSLAGGFMGFHGCCTQMVASINTHHLLVPRVRSLKRVSWGWIKVLAALAPAGGPRGEFGSLSSPVPSRCLHSLARGPFLCLQSISLPLLIPSSYLLFSDFEPLSKTCDDVGPTRTIQDDLLRSTPAAKSLLPQKVHIPKSQE